MSAERVRAVAEEELRKQREEIEGIASAERERASQLHRALTAENKARVHAEKECSRLRDDLSRRHDHAIAIASARHNARIRACKEGTLLCWRERVREERRDNHKHLQAALFRDQWTQRVSLMAWRKWAFSALNSRRKREKADYAEQAKREAREECADELSRLRSEKQSLRSSVSESDEEKERLQQTVSALLRGVCALNIEALNYDSSGSVPPLSAEEMKRIQNATHGHPPHQDQEYHGDQEINTAMPTSTTATPQPRTEPPVPAPQSAS